jgi:23S rRNA pseudouridine1911/1915/1917 synthase
MTVVARGRGKHAVTHFEVLEPFLFTSVAAFRLETGRTHQIRVHAKQIRHPILGDATYGGDAIRYGPVTSKRKAFFANLLQRIPRQALHAETLGFVHPQSGEHIDFQVDPPEDMQYAIRRLREIEGS